MNCKVCGKQLTTQKTYCSDPCRREGSKNLDKRIREQYGEEGYRKLKQKGAKKVGSRPRVNY